MQNLLERIKKKEARLGVIGMGYVGLPLAVEFAKTGFQVVGIDIDPKKVAAINQGQSYIMDIPTATIAPLVKEGKLKASTDFAVIRELDSINICVPTPLRKTKDPDVSFIVKAVDDMLPYLHPGFLIILESTTYPGSTEELILPRLQERGFEVGRDIFLAFSPERVDPGNKTYTTKNVPKVVGGMTPACTKLACTLYEQSLERVIPVSSPRVAEMVKLLENTFRIVNIGLVNEMALLSDKMGINVWEVIEAAATKPFGFMPFYPGPGLGGHCIPIDPFYLSWKARAVGFETRFIELAGMINSFMPDHVLHKIIDGLNTQGKCLKDARILFLGVAYKADIDDVRESPALDIIRMLQERGALVSYADPYVPCLRLASEEVVKSQSLTDKTLQEADCVVIITAHKCFDYRLVPEKGRLIVDTRNALKGFQGTHIVKL